ncbi:protein ECERIFERUM 16 [Solanum dulcamara]|uniref:protein ECERIFERUM 16 n=1 Tax=Solanum dulcamara TaxID=45834 RepID=UPI0024857081|nr:protein ECERIFERUM 16 [Solanum dulcamara]
MDAKALAKSKRAHSLHLNKKHNLHHASKGSSAVSGTSAGDKKVSVKQVKEKPKPKLPSNWDRYEEQHSDSETATQEGTSNTSDVVEPKSKGADYAYLLSEAKAQFQYSSENVSFCDDILDDFYQGLGALLSAKGQSKLSWIAEDNFAMEDKAPPPTKASFLSLDLQALSEQVERASLQERLFIEPDLLPLVLSAEESQPAAKEKHDNVLTSNNSSTAEIDSNSLTSTSVYKSNENRHQHSEFSSAFKAAAAEAELDMLLDSVTEIGIFESTIVTDQSIRPYPVTQAETPTPLSEGTSSMQEVSTQPKRGRDLAKPAISDISLDDTLDDLLKETSTVTNKNDHSLPNEVNSIAGHTSFASQPVSKSQIIDDFDSWFDAL